MIRNLDRNRFDVVPISIDKKGRWHANDVSLITDTKALPVFENSPKVLLPPNPVDIKTGENNLVSVQSGAVSGSSALGGTHIDVVFPVMHGPLCEDGSIQGLFELASLAYVGAGVLGSAVGMDKDVAKRLARDAGIPIVLYLAPKKEVWLRNPSVIAQQVEKELGYPSS